jgi:hypothetical protein
MDELRFRHNKWDESEFGDIGTLPVDPSPF